MADTDIVIRTEPLREYIAAICKAAGSSAGEADRIATQLIEANLRGHDSHGVIRVPGYVGYATSGVLRPGAAPSIVRETVSTALLDAGWNYGQIGAWHATNLAIAKARETGIGWVSAFQCGHIGRVGAYGEQIVEAGMIAFGGVNSPGGRLTAAFGGAHRRTGTSPIMIAMPGPSAEEPFVLDMATSVIAEGKVRVAVNKGTQLKPQLIIDAATLTGAAKTDVESAASAPIAAAAARRCLRAMRIPLFCLTTGAAPSADESWEHYCGSGVTQVSLGGNP